MRADRAGLQQLLVERIAVLEPPGRHPRRRADGVDRRLREGDVERAIFAAEEAGGGERFQFLPFTQIKPLADVDERRHRVVEGPQRLGDHRADVRGRRALRRSVTGVPLILMPRMEDKAEIARGVGADQGAAIHHPGQFLQALGELDSIDDRRNRRKRAENGRGLHPLLVGNIALGVKRLGRGHAAGHPEDDQPVGGGGDFFERRSAPQFRRAG